MQIQASGPHILHAPIYIPMAGIRGEEFGTVARDVTIIGISSYPNEQLTFIVQGRQGWIYTYVPAHYLTLGGNWIMQKKTFTCKGLEFVICNPLVPTFEVKEGKAKSLFAVDWLNKNELLHCGSLMDGGGIVIYPHREFIVENCPPLKKMKSTWK